MMQLAQTLDLQVHQTLESIRDISVPLPESRSQCHRSYTNFPSTNQPTNQPICLDKEIPSAALLSGRLRHSWSNRGKNTALLGGGVCRLTG